MFLKCYFWSKDKSHVVSQAEIAADPSIVLDAVKDGRAARQHLCCGDLPEDVIRGVKSRKVVGDVKGWAEVIWRDERYAPILALPAGASLRLDWKGEANGYAFTGQPPRHSCGIKDFRNDRVLGRFRNMDRAGPMAGALCPISTTRVTWRPLSFTPEARRQTWRPAAVSESPS